MIPADFTQYFRNIELPKSNSHKGQNGKVMVIGGSELFHAASQWALTVVSRMVDMVFYSSVPSNNDLIQDAKKHFPNGIVIPRNEIENYIEEADVVLIGPGMERIQETEDLTNSLLKKYADKKWVIDAGALQMIDPKLLKANHIITPHPGEFERVAKKIEKKFESEKWRQEIFLQNPMSNYQLPITISSTVLLKGPTDLVFNAKQQKKVTAGNEGMTKGGTGDVLAGLVAGLYCFTDDPFSAAIVGSYINKKAGDELYKKVGPFFNATDLANQIPQTLANTFEYTS